MKNSENKYETLILTKKEAVAKVILNRPDKMNALNPKMFEDIAEVFKHIATDDSIRAVIVSGAGEAFSAGGDVIEDILPISNMTLSEFKDYFEKGSRAYKEMFNLQKPVIGAINGFAVGGGLEIALLCDIRIASEKARFGQGFVWMGLVAEVGTYLMSRIIGLGRAKLLSFTGDLIDASEAERIGLVEKVIPANQLEQYAEELAKRLADGPAESIGTIKKALNESLRMDFDSSLDYVSGLVYQLTHSDEHKEAVKAFIEKRKPVFRVNK